MQVITRKQAQDLQLKWYFTGKPCKHGHIADRQTANGRCKECSYGDPKNVERRQRWAASNPEAVLEHNRNYRLNMTEEQKEKERNRKAESARRNGATRQAWRKKNPEKVAIYNLRSRVKRSADPVLAIAHRLRSRVQTSLKAHKGIKASKTEALVGCSWAFLRCYLEAQFTEGMTWENMGEWHIDHIVPCASFDLTDPAQQRECFHYTNLQPLWWQDNLSKGAKLVA